MLRGSSHLVTSKRVWPPIYNLINTYKYLEIKQSTNIYIYIKFLHGGQVQLATWGALVRPEKHPHHVDYFIALCGADSIDFWARRNPRSEPRQSEAVRGESSDSGLRCPRSELLKSFSWSAAAKQHRSVRKDATGWWSQVCMRQFQNLGNMSIIWYSIQQVTVWTRFSYISPFFLFQCGAPSILM